MNETVAAALRRGAARLAEAGIDQPGREARLLLAHALGVTADGLLDRAQLVPTETFDALVTRRAAREPFAHITGRQGFWTLDLAVTPATLIPRADSEAVIESLLACRPREDPPGRVLDFGTGTGALLLAALAEYPAAVGVGVDRSPAALAVAASNARTCGLESRAMFVASDWGAALTGTFDAILANPPYIESADIATLMPEVAVHEPLAALDGGPDGLSAYRRLLPEIGRLLAPFGVAIVEIGARQERAVADLARKAGFSDPVLRRDLGGNARALTLRRIAG